jgi:hypothetical protein
MKKFKYLALLSLSLILLTGCSDDVHAEIERELRYSNSVTNAEEQNYMLDRVQSAKISARENNRHVLSIDIDINALRVLNTSLVGYGYYNYNQETDKSTFNLEVSGLSNLKVAIDEEQKLEAKLSLANLDLLNYDDVQLNFDAKPLNELIDLSMLFNLDKSLIKSYKKTNYIDFDTFGKGFLAYVFELDAEKLNEQLNINFKFTTNPFISFLSNSTSFETIEIIYLTGNVNLTDSLNAGLKVFVYNVNPNN